VSGGETSGSLGRAMAIGAFWMVASRWALRMIGLASTILLARLLAPQDFGLVAMAMLVVGLLETFGETGQRHALVRMHEPTREHYDTAWTFSVLIGVGTAAALALAAPLAARIFGEPRLVWIISLLSLRPLMGGFENIGTVDLQRRFEFRRDQEIIIYAKLVSFPVAIALALLLRSYVALIASILVNGLVRLALSYVYSLYRPRLSLARARDLWSFSAWTLVTHLTHFFSERTDRAAVGLLLGAQAMGTYTVAYEVATAPTEELIVPPERAFYAVYARAAGDPEALREHYLAALAFISLVAAATSTGVALVAEDAVRTLLGENWLAAIPLLPWLALGAGVLGIARTAITSLLAAGHAFANAMRGLAFVAMLVPLAWGGVGAYGMEGAAAARLLAALLIAPVLALLAVRLLGIPLRALIGSVWRPVAAAAAMAAAVRLVHPLLPPLPPLRLALDAVFGACVYAASVLLFWHAAGRPRGPERAVLETVSLRLRRTLALLR
jgi:lipopolysaccharide exporter